MNKINKTKGFTLIELMVSLAILSILVMVCAPSFQLSTVNNRIYSETDQIVTTLSLARAEALRQNNYISLCVSSGGTSCAGTNDFSTGSILFVNTNKAGFTSSSQILKINDAWNKGDKGTSSVTGGLITFGGDGSVSAAASILVCKASYKSYTINIATSGNIKATLNTGDAGC